MYAFGNGKNTSDELKKTILRTKEIAQSRRHATAQTLHFFLALLDDPDVLNVLNHLNFNVEKGKQDVIELMKVIPVVPDDDSAEAEDYNKNGPKNGIERLLQQMEFLFDFNTKKDKDGNNILARGYHALVAVWDTQRNSAIVKILEDQNISRIDILSRATTLGSGNDIQGNNTQKGHESRLASTVPTAGTTKSVHDFCINITARVRDGKVDPVLGRDKEIVDTIEALKRRSKNNPILVGEAGVGKTAVVEGVARYMLDSERCPQDLLNSEIFALDLAALVAGTRYRGDFEERLKLVVNGIKSMPKAILFIDEVHMISGLGAAGGEANDAANILKPELARGDLRVIGATTFDEYRKFVEKDPALKRRFKKIVVEEPTQDHAIKILDGLRSILEGHHGVKITDEAIRAAVELSVRHMPAMQLPDKAIECLDDASAHVSVALARPGSGRESNEISKSDVMYAICRATGIPFNEDSLKSDKLRLRTLETDLSRCILNQDRAVRAVSSAIKLAKTDLHDANKPLLSMLFTGPTGVGKTELATQLAKILNIPLKRFDMTEFAEKHSASRLVGAPPGFVGYGEAGQLTEAVRKNPHCIVLFDEFEKAHRDIYNLLLQVMDYGFMTDASGRKVDFRNTIIIMTSNVGVFESETRSPGFVMSGGHGQERGSDGFNEAIKSQFSPEFLARLDDIIVFNRLSEDNMLMIVDKFLAEYDIKLAEKGIELIVPHDVKMALISKENVDPQKGARQVKLSIKKNILSKLSDIVLDDEMDRGGVVEFYMDGKTITMKSIPNEMDLDGDMELELTAN